jgi:hypothetical protein
VLLAPKRILVIKKKYKDQICKKEKNRGFNK